MGRLLATALFGALAAGAQGVLARTTLTLTTPSTLTVGQGGIAYFTNADYPSGGGADLRVQCSGATVEPEFICARGLADSSAHSGQFVITPNANLGVGAIVSCNASLSGPETMGSSTEAYDFAQAGFNTLPAVNGYIFFTPAIVAPLPVTVAPTLTTGASIDNPMKLFIGEEFEGTIEPDAKFYPTLTDSDFMITTQCGAINEQWTVISPANSNSFPSAAPGEGKASFNFQFKGSQLGLARCDFIYEAAAATRSRLSGSPALDFGRLAPIPPMFFMVVPGVKLLAPNTAAHITGEAASTYVITLTNPKITTDLVLTTGLAECTGLAGVTIVASGGSSVTQGANNQGLTGTFDNKKTDDILYTLSIPKTDVGAVIKCTFTAMTDNKDNAYITDARYRYDASGFSTPTIYIPIGKPATLVVSGVPQYAIEPNEDAEAITISAPAGHPVCPDCDVRVVASCVAFGDLAVTSLSATVTDTNAGSATFNAQQIGFVANTTVVCTWAIDYTSTSDGSFLPPAPTTFLIAGLQKINVVGVPTVVPSAVAATSGSAIIVRKPTLSNTDTLKLTLKCLARDTVNAIVKVTAPGSDVVQAINGDAQTSSVEFSKDSTADATFNVTISAPLAPHTGTQVDCSWDVSGTYRKFDWKMMPPFSFFVGTQVQLTTSFLGDYTVQVPIMYQTQFQFSAAGSADPTAQIYPPPAAPAPDRRLLAVPVGLIINTVCRPETCADRTSQTGVAKTPRVQTQLVGTFPVENTVTISAPDTRDGALGDVRCRFTIDPSSVDALHFLPPQDLILTIVDVVEPFIVASGGLVSPFPLAVAGGSLHTIQPVSAGTFNVTMSSPMRQVDVSLTCTDILNGATSFKVTGFGGNSASGNTVSYTAAPSMNSASFLIEVASSLKGSSVKCVWTIAGVQQHFVRKPVDFDFFAGTPVPVTTDYQFDPINLYPGLSSDDVKFSTAGGVMPDATFSVVASCTPSTVGVPSEANAAGQLVFQMTPTGASTEFRFRALTPGNATCTFTAVPDLTSDYRRFTMPSPLKFFVHTPASLVVTGTLPGATFSDNGIITTATIIVTLPTSLPTFPSDLRAYIYRPTCSTPHDSLDVEGDGQYLTFPSNPFATYTVTLPSINHDFDDMRSTVITCTFSTSANTNQWLYTPANVQAVIGDPITLVPHLPLGPIYANPQLPIEFEQMKNDGSAYATQDPASLPGNSLIGVSTTYLGDLYRSTGQYPVRIDYSHCLGYRYDTVTSMSATCDNGATLVKADSNMDEATMWTFTPSSRIGTINCTVSLSLQYLYAQASTVISFTVVPREDIRVIGFPSSITNTANFTFAPSVAAGPGGVSFLVTDGTDVMSGLGRATSIPIPEFFFAEGDVRPQQVTLQATAVKPSATFYIVPIGGAMNKYNYATLTAPVNMLKDIGAVSTNTADNCDNPSLNVSVTLTIGGYHIAPSNQLEAELHCLTDLRVTGTSGYFGSYDENFVVTYPRNNRRLTFNVDGSQDPLSQTVYVSPSADLTLPAQASCQWVWIEDGNLFAPPAPFLLQFDAPLPITINVPSVVAAGSPATISVSVAASNAPTAKGAYWEFRSFDKDALFVGGTPAVPNHPNAQALFLIPGQLSASIQLLAPKAGVESVSFEMFGGFEAYRYDTPMRKTYTIAIVAPNSVQASATDATTDLSAIAPGKAFPIGIFIPLGTVAVDYNVTVDCGSAVTMQTATQTVKANVRPTLTFAAIVPEDAPDGTITGHCSYTYSGAGAAIVAPVSATTFTVEVSAANGGGSNPDDPVGPPNGGNGGASGGNGSTGPNGGGSTPSSPVNTAMDVLFRFTGDVTKDVTASFRTSVPAAVCAALSWDSSRCIYVSSVAGSIMTTVQLRPAADGSGISMQKALSTLQAQLTNSKSTLRTSTAFATVDPTFTPSGTTQTRCADGSFPNSSTPCPSTTSAISAAAITAPNALAILAIALALTLA